ncbi:MAG: hypothetical protein II726_01635, partial [Elusimicrobiaceae bacterium]|nr:hypothetical protein [Elusimicrobiaceae bacterium]
ISAQSANTKNDMVFAAMQQEMNRTMALSKTEPKIHFVAFKVNEVMELSIIAARGGIVQENKTDDVYTDVSLRVGNNQEDNSFFEAYTYNQSTMQYGGISPEAIRAGLWAAVDKSYKDALDIYARKQGYKNKKNTEEVFDDFSIITPIQDLRVYEKTVLPLKTLKEIAQKTSTAGALAELEKFNTQVTAIEEISYYLSSEGSKYTKRDFIVQISFYAKSRTMTGFEFNDTKTLTYASLKDLPTAKELADIAYNFAKQTASFTKAEKGTAFIGPIWLAGEASAKMFENTFIKNINNTRKIIYDTGDGKFQYSLGEFALKENLKVLTVNFDFIDNPLQEEFNGKRTIGTYQIDDEGTKAEALFLVKNGILKDLPKTRALIKGQKKTNGHAFVNWGQDLYAKASVKNLFFFPHETTPIENFKQKFMDFCKAEGLEYCYKISSRDVTSKGDILAVKINANTGEETPVYGLNAPALNSRTLRDIKFAADDLTLYNTTAGFSYVVPSVILSEVELTPSQASPATKMLVTRPNI